jgi:thiopeptide-type bacteriocin biosynthesis protein
VFEEVVIWGRRARALRQYFFIRKPPGLRLRFLPTRAARDDVIDTVIRRFRSLMRTGHLRQVFTSTYEPETYQFGGPQAMALTHAHFTSDTLLWCRIRALAAVGETQIAGEVLCLALVNDLLLRCLDQAPEEAWDVWCNLARLHGFPVRVDLGSPAKHLLPAVRTGDLAGAVGSAEREILVAYGRANERLAQGMRRLQGRSRLLCGIREILPWIVIFQWNRHWLSMAHRRKLCAAMMTMLSPKRLLAPAPLAVSDVGSAPTLVRRTTKKKRPERHHTRAEER